MAFIACAVSAHCCQRLRRTHRKKPRRKTPAPTPITWCVSSSWRPWCSRSPSCRCAGGLALLLSPLLTSICAAAVCLATGPGARSGLTCPEPLYVCTLVLLSHDVRLPGHAGRRGCLTVIYQPRGEIGAGLPLKILRHRSKVPWQPLWSLPRPPDKFMGAAVRELVPQPPMCNRLCPSSPGYTGHLLK